MLHLRYRGTTTIPIEAECLTPNNLVGKTTNEIASLLVQYGNSLAPLGDFFSIEGYSSNKEIVIDGDCGRVKRIGAGMASGRIIVRGDVGMHLGAEMTGGEIHGHGRAADWVGAEMRGGRIHVHCDAGSLVGAAYRGASIGMRGGVILIEGRAGNEVGARMRRGLIAVGGDVGDFVGVGMIAGGVFVFGRAGLRPGAGMKRGTLAFGGDLPGLLPSFRYDCDYRPMFLSLYFRQLRAWNFPIHDRLFKGSWHRYSGDLIEMGKGEILHWKES